MFNLFRAELLKQSRTALFRVLLLAPGFVTLGLAVVFIIAKSLAGADFGSTPPSNVMGGQGADFGGSIYRLSAAIMLEGIGGLYSLGLVILAGQIISSEFNFSTIKMIATREASRWRILLVKILYLAFMTVLICLIVFSCWLAYSFILKIAYSQPLGLDSVDTDALGKGLKFIFLTFGFYFIWGLMSIMLAMRFKSVIASVIFYFIYSAIDGAASSIGVAALNGEMSNNVPGWLQPLLDFARFLAPFLLNTNYSRLAYQPNDSRYTATISAFQAGAVLLVWAAIFIFLAFLVFRNRDITD